MVLDPDWHCLRLLLSQGGNWFARCIADIHGVIDCTSGFRAIRSQMLEPVDVAHLPFNGYAFQIPVAYLKGR